jgi:hypothetical protein
VTALPETAIATREVLKPPDNPPSARDVFAELMLEKEPDAQEIAVAVASWDWIVGTGGT